MANYSYGKRTESEYKTEEMQIKKGQPKLSEKAIKAEMNARRQMDILAQKNSSTKNNKKR